MMVSTLIPEVNDIVEAQEERELWIVAKEHERPPFFHAGKGGDTRLTRAIRLCLDDKITPQSDGSYQVQGSEGRVYRVAESCSCPQSQKASSRWCYHAVGVAVYVEWQKRLQPALPLGPASVEERLAQAVPQTYGARQAAKARGPVPPVATPAQEVLMADDVYIPEPDNVLHTATATAVLDPPRASIGGVQAPLAAEVLEHSLAEWSRQRAVITRYIKQHMVEGTDFYSIKVQGRDTRPTLGKSGAEKFLNLFQLQASFRKDEDTWEMLGRPTGVLCYVCTLHTRGGEVVGEGRGCRDIKKDGGDINKAVKMSQKSSMIDAILRTGALSDAFTQDLDEGQEAPVRPTSGDLRSRIWALVKAADPSLTTREQVQTYVMHQTGYALQDNHYREIVRILEKDA